MSSLAQDLIRGLRKPRDANVDVTANGTDTTLLTVSTQDSRKYYAEGLIIYNAHTATVVFSLWDGPSATGTLKGRWSIATGVVLPLDFSVGGSQFGGMEFETSMIIQAATGSANTNVQTTGYEL